jgi:hypothetical protein
LYGTGLLEWQNESYGYWYRWSFIPYDLYVGDYSSISIVLKFSNVHDGGHFTYWTVRISWTDPSTGYSISESLTTSTLYCLRPFSVDQILAGSYAIKGPYIRISPELVNRVETAGNATLSIYVFLANAIPPEPLPRAISWFEYEHTEAQQSIFPYYGLTKGFRQITIQFFSNTTCNFMVYGRSGTLDDFSYSTPYTYISKVYQLASDYIIVKAYTPSMTPWYIELVFYETV